MTICYFGDYVLNGRTHVLRLAMEEAGVHIVDCNSNEMGIRFFIDLFKKHRALKGKYDILFIGNSGPSNFLPLFAQIITKKPVVWEPLFSIYDNYIFDRKFAPRYSVKALYYFIMDWVGGHTADAVVLDTDEDCKYFSETFHVRRDKCLRVLIGADTNAFVPMVVPKEGTRFEVEYHGKYIPVQGIDVIVRAAKLLEDDRDIHFTMIGSGQAYKETVALAESLKTTNITFLPFMPVAELRPYIARADVCFGLVGDVPRVVRAIPNKLYEAAAMGKVTINADTVALREVFTPGVDVIAVPQGNHEAVAKAIRELKVSGSAKELGENARKTLHEKVSFAKIGEELKIVFDYVS
jgi:glycosyltransferase involved in cell wall biosynthesis